jgi:hypothetical protein
MSKVPSAFIGVTGNKDKTGSFGRRDGPSA